ncbi:hypothetical protein B484DRAFT_452092 [Ochromonadaceae sp. CCMP2298]|nr:hypothetical protein B484DRAFT_452092 [Ochromonadaceae sp. CCMP2298]
MSVRRVWDKEFYEQKAKERAEQGDDYVDEDEGPKKVRRLAKEEFQAAGDGAAGPIGSERAFLKVRQGKVDLDSKVGKTEVINPTQAGELRGAGFWCETCSCLLKDSVSYLDHINGKKHQRTLGFSMRVERAEVDTVKNRMAELRQKMAKKGSVSARSSAISEYDNRLQADLKEKDEAKAKMRGAAEDRKREKKELEAAAALAEAEEGGGEEGDEFQTMMGFGGFGSSKR